MTFELPSFSSILPTSNTFLPDSGPLPASIAAPLPPDTFSIGGVTRPTPPAGIQPIGPTPVPTVAGAGTVPIAAAPMMPTMPTPMVDPAIAAFNQQGQAMAAHFQTGGDSPYMQEIAKMLSSPAPGSGMPGM